MDKNFWKNIKAYKDFKSSFDLESYIPFCPSWHLFIADIRGSTLAIKEGRYKEVNMVGAMSIVAVMLRITCSVNTEERKKLESYLQNKYDMNNLCYGIHISDRALMTCLVFERMGSQVHFVDTAGGGYAMAAIGLKQQLKIN